MTKVITGKKFNTSFGTMIIHNEQDTRLSKGDNVNFENMDYSIVAIVPPTRPDGKWALQVDNKKAEVV